MKKLYIIQIDRHCLWEDIYKSCNLDKVLYNYLRLKSLKYIVRVVEVSVR